MKTYNQTELEKRDLENEYSSLKQNLTEIELLEIFPEAKPYLRNKLKILKKELKDLSWEIKENLTMLYRKELDKESTAFGEEVIKVFKGDKLEEINKKIKKLKFLLNPPPKQKSGGITPGQIARAKNYPFETLLPIKKNLGLCPFHSDTNPSFYTKNNWGYCWSCGWHGDTIQFLIEIKGLKFNEAVLQLQ